MFYKIEHKVITGIVVITYIDNFNINPTGHLASVPYPCYYTKTLLGADRVLKFVVFSQNNCNMNSYIDYWFTFNIDFYLQISLDTGYDDSATGI